MADTHDNNAPGTVWIDSTYDGGESLRVQIVKPKSGRQNTTAVFIAHGRFQVGRYLTGTLFAFPPYSVAVVYYVRHGESLTRTNADKIIDGLSIGVQRGYEYWLEEGGNPYAGLLKNYTLRPDPKFKREATDFYDVIYPVDIVCTNDIFNAITVNKLPAYTTIHFICCRALRFTEARLI